MVNFPTGTSDKATPVLADLLLIADTEDSSNAKDITIAQALALQTKANIDVLNVDAQTVNSLTVETAVPSGAVFTDTNTTYTIQDGELSEKNFTTALNTKLSGIEAGADVTDATNVAAAGALMTSAVGTTVQAYDANTTKNDEANTFTAAQTFTTTRNTAGLELNAQTGTTYTLLITDAGKMLTLNNASAITLTIPENSSVAFPVGCAILVMQLGAGQVTVTGAGSVSIDSTDSYVKIAKQNAAVYLMKKATDNWALVGNLSA